MVVIYLPHLFEGENPWQLKNDKYNESNNTILQEAMKNISKKSSV